MSRGRKGISSGEEVSVTLDGHLLTTAVTTAVDVTSILITGGRNLRASTCGSPVNVPAVYCNRASATCVKRIGAVTRYRRLLSTSLLITVDSVRDQIGIPLAVRHQTTLISFICGIKNAGFNGSALLGGLGTNSTHNTYTRLSE